MDGSAQTLTHNTASITQAQMTLAAESSTAYRSPAPIITGGSIDITSQITGGQLSGLLQLRDTSLSNIQSQIDTMAQALQTGLNQINNRGTSFPSGGQSFTGTATFLNPGSQNISLASGERPSPCSMATEPRRPAPRCR